MFKPGDFVRHRSKPEWGLGRVTGQTVEGKVLVKFTNRAGDVLLTAAGAEQHLTADTGTPVSFTPSTPNRPTVTTRRPCVSCAKDLQEAVTAADGAWRACPQCTSRDGRQHVYLPYPDGFDVSPTDAATENADAVPDPRQRWCRACRTGVRAQGFRLCRDLRI